MHAAHDTDGLVVGHAYKVERDGVAPDHTYNIYRLEMFVPRVGTAYRAWVKVDSAHTADFANVLVSRMMGPIDTCLWRV